MTGCAGLIGPASQQSSTKLGCRWLLGSEIPLLLHLGRSDRVNAVPGLPLVKEANGTFRSCQIKKKKKKKKKRAWGRGLQAVSQAPEDRTASRMSLWWGPMEQSHSLLPPLRLGRDTTPHPHPQGQAGRNISIGLALTRGQWSVNPVILAFWP